MQLKFICHINCEVGMPSLFHILCSYYASYYKCLKPNSLETTTLTECSTIFLEPTSKSLAWVNQVFFLETCSMQNFDLSLLGLRMRRDALYSQTDIQMTGRQLYVEYCTYVLMHLLFFVATCSWLYKQLYLTCILPYTLSTTFSMKQ